MKAAERIQRGWPERTGRWDGVIIAVLTAAVLLVATALVAKCLSGAVTDLP
jgi:hypothetical protein